MMMFRSRSSTLVWLCSLALLLLSRRPFFAAAEEEGPLAFVRGKFDALDDKGKFIAGAAAGFVGSRIIVGSAMKVVKIGAAAFITAEIMNQMGVIDYHDVIEDHYDTITKVKDVCMSKIDGYRKTVRTTLNPQKIQAFAEKERMASFGLGAGSLAGLVL